MKHRNKTLLFVFVSVILLFAATVAQSPVLVAVSFVVVFIGVGVSVYRIAQKTGTGKERRNFFLVSYAGSLAALVAGVAVMLYARSEEAELLAAFITVIGLGWAGALTGALVACAIARAAGKKRRAQEMANLPKDEHINPGG